MKTQFILQFIQRSLNVVESFTCPTKRQRSWSAGVIKLILVILFAVSLTDSRAQDTWTQKADFGGTARNNAVGFSIGSKGYLGTGASGGYSKDFWEYDPDANTWTQKADFGGNSRYAAVGFSIGSKGYLGTGVNAGPIFKDFWEYDPVANTWTQKADFGGTARQNAVGFSIGNKGYLGTGAKNGGTYYNDFWEYDPALNTWTQKADFGGASRYGAVGFSIAGKGYLGTGSGSAIYTDFWEYDPQANSWTQKADVGGTPRLWAVGFSIGGKGYLGTGSYGAFLTDFWTYDPSVNTWTQKADFGGTARYIAVGFSIGSKGYLGTGNNGYQPYWKDFWEYTPECNGFTVYADGDADSYGDVSNSYFVSDCIVPGGYVYDVTDCNDADASVHPGAAEVLNGIDDNCNGITDDAVVCLFPSNLSVIKITGTTAKLKWDAVTGAEGYKVRYKVASTTEWKHGTTYNNSKPISGLLPNTVYKWEVKTFCQVVPGVMSDWSPLQSFTTGSLRMSEGTPIEGDEQGVSLKLYPNPVFENFTLHLLFPKGDLMDNSITNQSVDIFLVNEFGQIVYSEKAGAANGELKKEISMPSSASSGWYIVRVVLNEQVIERKLLYEK